MYLQLEADTAAESEERSEGEGGEIADGTVSLRGRRQDVGESERRRHAPVLLLAGARRSDEPESRVLVEHADQVFTRRRQDDRQHDEQRARRPPRDVDRPEGSVAHHRRRRRRRGADVGLGRQLGLDEPAPDRPVLQRFVRHGGAVQRVRRRAGQRRVVRAEPPRAAARSPTRCGTRSTAATVS